MLIHQELQSVRPDRDSVLTIGMFDGVHLGHRRLIECVISEARLQGMAAGVVTFRNHPASVLRPELKPPLLATLDERLALIESLGVDYVVPITFDAALSRRTAADFLALLKKHLRMRAMVTGPDFAMGHNRTGDVGTLSSLSAEMGFSLRTVEPLTDAHGEAVRSTTVRRLLSAGDVERAAAQLGRRFALKGVVVHGAGRGGPMGFPTANIKPPEDMVVPGDGIYATVVIVGGSRYMAATSVGAPPMFEGVARAIEAFILDFEGDLYGREIRLEFVQRLRGQVKFDSVPALQGQVARDVAATRAALGRAITH